MAPDWRWPDSMLLVGCGNMGGAMLEGWLASGMDASRFTIIDPQLGEAPHGVELLRQVPDRRFDALLLAVKPQLLAEVGPAVASVVTGDCVVLSILAGVRLPHLASRFPKAGGLVRIMPNLAAAIGKSPVALAAQGLDAGQSTAVTKLMEPLGTPQWLEDEGLFDLVTALAGSGPAFVYRFIDAMASGAADLGLHPDQARQLALATVEGAALLASGSEHSPAELANRVASPGGTTRAGLDVLDTDEALSRLLEATLRAARDRSAELAREAGK